MKKIFYLFINLLIFAGVLLAITGCSSNTETETSSTPTTPTPDNPEVILATTTSTQDSGLLDVLVPMFEEQTGYHVKTVAVGTGAALAMGEQGEADVLLVHAPTSELPLMENGDCISRKLVMHNDFVIVGPPSDPAGISGTSDAVAALKAIADSESIFISRGDDSGTNKMELSLWSKTSVDPSGQSWSTFLRNHAPHIAAMDLFVVPTIGFVQLYVLVIVRLARRELVWINVTRHPTAEWINTAARAGVYRKPHPSMIWAKFPVPAMKFPVRPKIIPCSFG